MLTYSVFSLQCAHMELHIHACPWFRSVIIHIGATTTFQSQLVSLLSLDFFLTFMPYKPVVFCIYKINELLTERNPFYICMQRKHFEHFELEGIPQGLKSWDKVCTRRCVLCILRDKNEIKQVLF